MDFESTTKIPIIHNNQIIILYIYFIDTLSHSCPPKFPLVTAHASLHALRLVLLC